MERSPGCSRDIHHLKKCHPNKVFSCASVDDGSRKYCKRSSFGRSPTPQLKRENLSPEKLNRRFENTSFDTLEPPPPGFEATHSMQNRGWINHNLKQHNFIRSMTPDLYETFVSSDLEQRKLYDICPGDERSRSSNKSSEKKRKYTRSTTPTSKLQTVNSQKKSHPVVMLEKESKRERNSILEKKTGTDPKYDKEPDRGQEQSSKNSMKFENQVINNQRTYNIEKDSALKKSNIENNKTEKKIRERKKKRKEKNERKKLKKEKKDKRDREKQKIIAELDSDINNLSLQPESTEILSTSEINEMHDSGNSKTEALNTFFNSNEQQKQKENLNGEKQLLVTIKQTPAQPVVNYRCIDMCEGVQVSDCDNSSKFHSMRPLKDKGPNKVTPPSEFKRFDSVLDIHGYDTDFEEIHSQDKNNKILLPVPEPSKWEREDQNVSEIHSTLLKDEEENKIGSDCNEKVTTEVLRKAENAIFARAINAIRPIEMKRVNFERQKLCSMESIGPILNTCADIAIDKMGTFQITVPTNYNQERSVEIRGKSRKRSRSPKLTVSVKDRLGSKIVNKNEVSPNKSSHNKSITNINKSDNQYTRHYETGREKEIENIVKKQDRFRNSERSYDCKAVKRYFDFKDSGNKAHMVVHHHRERHQHQDNKSCRTDDRCQSHRIWEYSKTNKTSNYYRGRGECKSQNFKNGANFAEKSQNSKLKPKLSGSESKNSHERKTFKYDLLDQNVIKPKLNQIVGSFNYKFEDLDDKMKSNTKKSNFAYVQHTSACSTTDSDSESLDSKRKKKRKYKDKKDKKKDKRSCSTESIINDKLKHNKNKKKNKSTKKKKKAKK